MHFNAPPRRKVLCLGVLQAQRFSHESCSSCVTARVPLAKYKALHVRNVYSPRSIVTNDGRRDSELEPECQCDGPGGQLETPAHVPVMHT
eukprot:2353247-Rhodomonas_salina.1